MQSEVAFEPILAVFRDGKLLGSDSEGAVYTGAPDPADARASRQKLLVTCDVPPNGEFATGVTGGPNGATVLIVGVVEETLLSQQTTVVIADQSIGVEISYLGPLPN